MSYKREMKSYSHKLMQLFKTSFKNFVYKSGLLFFAFSSTVLYANNVIESQPQVIFELDRLKSSSENLEIQVDFNKAVLHFKKGEYDLALKLFEKTSQIFEVPSLLNMGIIYYKQNNKDKAIELFSKIYAKKTNLLNQPYSFISACYYLFAITKDDKYMLDLVTIFQNSKKLSEYSELITDIQDAILKELANRYLLIKDYENAIGALNAMSYSLDFKKAMVYIKLNNYQKASSLLRELRNKKTDDEDTYDKILWVSTYADLKLNKFDDVQETLDLINDRKNSFTINTTMPLEIFFNKDFHSYKDYFQGVMKFDEDRKYDFIYYFAPFVFSDSKEIIYDSVKGFIYQDTHNVENLEEMVAYNTKFVNLVDKDSINRVNGLKELVKIDSKAYTYYNLAIAYAQIKDYHNAFKNFEKAYKLSPGNGLYAIMYLITSNKVTVGLVDNQKSLIEKNIKEGSGLYSYFSKELYKMFVNTGYNVVESSLQYENTIFFKAIDFLKAMNNNEPLHNHILLNEYDRDPFVYLIRTMQRGNNESDNDYFTRLQDNIPLRHNSIFINNSFVISKYYIDILKALGTFKRADFTMQNANNSPTYLATAAYASLYLGRPEITIGILKRLKEEFSYENRHSMYLMVAAYLESLRPEEASLQISLIKALYKDTDTDFLTAIQLIQNMNISSAKQFLDIKYKNPYIDFKMIGFDELMQNL